MKIIVSACLLGENCKYNGGNNRNQNVINYIAGHEVIAVCPEVAGGLSTPRIPIERSGNRIINQKREDMTTYLQAGIQNIMQEIKDQPIALAILQSRSPSCGCKQIYDGTFTKTLISGKGIFAQTLSDANIPLMDSEDVPKSR